MSEGPIVSFEGHWNMTAQNIAKFKELLGLKF